MISVYKRLICVGGKDGKFDEGGLRLEKNAVIVKLSHLVARDYFLNDVVILGTLIQMTHSSPLFPTKVSVGHANGSVRFCSITKKKQRVYRA